MAAKRTSSNNNNNNNNSNNNNNNTKDSNVDICQNHGKKAETNILFVWINLNIQDADVILLDQRVRLLDSWQGHPIDVVWTHVDVHITHLSELATVIVVVHLGGGFKDFLFSSLLGEDSQFDQYFSRGLKPPTSHVLYCL